MLQSIAIAQSHSHVLYVALKTDHPESRKVDFTPQPNINNEALHSVSASMTALLHKKRRRRANPLHNAPVDTYRIGPSAVFEFSDTP